MRQQGTAVTNTQPGDRPASAPLTAPATPAAIEAPSALSESQQRTLSALARMIQLSGDQFSVRIAICDSQATTDTVVGILTESRCILPLHLPANECEWDPVQSIRQEVNGNDRRCIFVFGLSEQLEPCSADNPGRILPVLNRSRERLKSLFSNQPIVFWLSDAAARNFSRGAPDLQAWTGAEFDFNE